MKKGLVNQGPFVVKLFNLILEFFCLIVHLDVHVH